MRGLLESLWVCKQWARKGTDEVAMRCFDALVHFPPGNEFVDAQIGRQTRRGRSDSTGGLVRRDALAL